MGGGLITYLAIGTVAMFLIMLYCNKYYRIRLWKLVPGCLLLAVSGVAGALLMYFVENGSFGGQSFYGAVFFPPLTMWLYSKAVKEKAGDIIDLCAPAECVMLAVLKVNCYVSGCCEGIALGAYSDGSYLRFPSQIAECGATLLIALLLIWFVLQGKQRGNLYPVYLIAYGASRFVLNFMRETSPVIWKLAIGHLWSLAAVAVGIALTINWKRRTEAPAAKGEAR